MQTWVREGIVHCLAGFGEDIGLVFGWVWFEVFFAALGEARGGCVG
jgi:hypothetical protein